MASSATLRPPEIGSIVKGTVNRIESYGAFISIASTRLRGLLHISQLSSYKVEAVEDCLSLDDVIYVKVVQCDEMEDTSSSVGGGGGAGGREGHSRKRYKIALSLKYASQDGTYTDLDPTNEQYERESRGKRNNSNNEDHRMSSSNRSGNQPSQLETSLNSHIGMGIAIDPLAAMKQATNSRLVLRNTSESGGSSSNKVLFNGYSLVDDNEGELPKNTINSNVVEDVPKKPLGRGRGATLPSWMTNNDDPLGRTSKDKNNSESDDDNSRRNSKRKKKRKKEDKKKKKRKKHRHSDQGYDSSISVEVEEVDDDDDEKERHHSRSRRRHHKKHKSSRRHHHSRSRSNSRSRYDDDNHRRKHKSKRHAQKKDHKSHSSDNESVSDQHKKQICHAEESSTEEPMFNSVEEAQALIAKLEQEKKCR